MSQTPENRFIDGVHAKIDPSVYFMKNHNAYVGGIADCWYSGPGADLWVEYKFFRLSKNPRPATLVPLLSGKDPMLASLQDEWLSDRHEENRSVGLIIGSPEGGVWFPGISWKEPMTVVQFRERLMSKADLAECIHRCVLAG